MLTRVVVKVPTEDVTSRLNEARRGIAAAPVFQRQLHLRFEKRAISQFEYYLRAVEALTVPVARFR